MPARVGSLVSEVEVGWSVWERVPDEADHERRGGVVVGIDDRRDADTGFVVRHFRTLKRFHGQLRFATLTEDQVNDEALELPNALTIRSLIRDIDSQIAKSKGMFTPEQVDLQEIAWRLMKAVA
jgi:hypothetical protein